ncbi:protein tyrosine phosphatase 36E [Brevipalpus obovatus]|uniref:protein tyrosine phosphatase 36E n=1 Tax=Brevipalpus obovatus TaxID=246614 RepID=UPI003D9E8E82
MESTFMKPSSSLSNSMLSTSSGVGQSGIYHRRGPPKSSTISSTSSTKIAQKVAKLARKRRKKDSGNKNAKCSLLYHKLNKGVASGALNRINKVQLKILNTGLINIDEEGEKASGIIPGKPFDLSKPRFRDHVKLLHKYMVLLKIEFHVATKGEIHSMRHGLKAANEEKNWNKKFVPYDYNRVVLEPLPGVPDSDYINASYVDSIVKPNAYIVTQGPKEETIGDFWRMVWEQNCYMIVMLTKVFDFIRVMCCQYWPIEMNKPEMYGPMEVTLLTEEPLADFTIRTIRVRRPDQLIEKTRNVSLDDKVNSSNSANSNNNNNTTTNNNISSNSNSDHMIEEDGRRTSGHDASITDDDDERVVYQFHYYNWPTHTCPFSNSLLQYQRRIRIYMNEVCKDINVGPTVVHCSDGCGRTGTYLCIDANLEFAEEDNMFDVFGYAKKMRAARKGMIESVDQYKFIYECLEEAYLSGKTWFPVSDLSSQMKYKSLKDPLTGKNEYQREYEKILKMATRFTIGDCAGGHRIENRDKNRDVAIVPPDDHRPYLTTFQSNDSTDYVNAVFVDGYTRSREYIVTEWPMQHTIPDCWSLIYDHDCNSVIILSHPDDHERKTFPNFWPNEKERRKKFGPVFTAELVSFNHYPNIKTWIFRINKKVVSLTELMSGVKGVPKTTQFFQITCWPPGHKVPSSTNALVELMNMVERWRQRTTYGPVCVISTNGKSRAGVYCAANVAIEQVVQHGEVDVFQAVKTVRRHRPQLIENMTEYKYCYDLILHYVLNYLNQNE